MRASNVVDEVGSSAGYSDPLEVLTDLAILVVEGRTPGGERGFHAGPHCPSMAPPGTNRHACDVDSPVCIRFESLARQLRLMWGVGVGVTVEVLLAPDCEHRCSPQGGAHQGFTTNLLDTSAAPSSHRKLIEQWNFIILDRKLPEAVSSGWSLIAAVRSFLHFSQLSAWICNSTGQKPPNVKYRLNVTSDVFCSKFVDGDPEDHVFPVALVGNQTSIKVVVRSLPRSNAMPTLVCSEHSSSLAASGLSQAQDQGVFHPRCSSSCNSSSSCSSPPHCSSPMESDQESHDESNGNGSKCSEFDLRRSLMKSRMLEGPVSQHGVTPVSHPSRCESPSSDTQLGESLLDPPNSLHRFPRRFQSPSRAGSPSMETPEHIICRARTPGPSHGRPPDYQRTNIPSDFRLNTIDYSTAGTSANLTPVVIPARQPIIRQNLHPLSWTQARYSSAQVQHGPTPIQTSPFVGVHPQQQLSLHHVAAQPVHMSTLSGAFCPTSGLGPHPGHPTNNPASNLYPQPHQMVSSPAHCYPAPMPVFHHQTPSGNVDFSHGYHSSLCENLQQFQHPVLPSCDASHIDTPLESKIRKFPNQWQRDLEMDTAGHCEVDTYKYGLPQFKYPHMLYEKQLQQGTEDGSNDGEFRSSNTQVPELQSLLVKPLSEHRNSVSGENVHDLESTKTSSSTRVSIERPSTPLPSRSPAYTRTPEQIVTSPWSPRPSAMEEMSRSPVHGSDFPDFVGFPRTSKFSGLFNSCGASKTSGSFSRSPSCSSEGSPTESKGLDILDETFSNSRISDCIMNRCLNDNCTMARCLRDKRATSLEASLEASLASKYLGSRSSSSSECSISSNYGGGVARSPAYTSCSLDATSFRLDEAVKVQHQNTAISLREGQGTKRKSTHSSDLCSNKRESPPHVFYANERESARTFGDGVFKDNEPPQGVPGAMLLHRKSSCDESMSDEMWNLCMQNSKHFCVNAIAADKGHEFEDTNASKKNLCSNLDMSSNKMNFDLTPKETQEILTVLRQSTPVPPLRMDQHMHAISEGEEQPSTSFTHLVLNPKLKDKFGGISMGDSNCNSNNEKNLRKECGSELMGCSKSPKWYGEKDDSCNKSPKWQCENDVWCCNATCSATLNIQKPSLPLQHCDDGGRHSDSGRHHSDGGRHHSDGVRYHAICKGGGNSTAAGGNGLILVSSNESCDNSFKSNNIKCFNVDRNLDDEMKLSDDDSVEDGLTREEIEKMQKEEEEEEVKRKIVGNYPSISPDWRYESAKQSSESAVSSCRRTQMNSVLSSIRRVSLDSKDEGNEETSARRNLNFDLSAVASSSRANQSSSESDSTVNRCTNLRKTLMKRCFKPYDLKPPTVLGGESKLMEKEGSTNESGIRKDISTTDVSCSSNDSRVLLNDKTSGIFSGITSSIVISNLQSSTNEKALDSNVSMSCQSSEISETSSQNGVTNQLSVDIPKKSTIGRKFRGAPLEINRNIEANDMFLCQNRGPIPSCSSFDNQMQVDEIEYSDKDDDIEDPNQYISEDEEISNLWHDQRNATPSVSIPSTNAQVEFRRSLDSAATLVFHRQTGLPLASSPAPLRKGKRFDYDSSLTSISALRSAFRTFKSTMETDSESEDGTSPLLIPPPNANNKFILSASAPATVACSNLLGSFEECVLNGRLEPVSTVHGFKCEIAASGAFCPKHIFKPVTVFFYTLCDNDQISSPYMGHINLGKKGYHIPKQGTVQVTLFNPHGTVVKMFVVVYDLSDMPANSRTFLRQRTLNMPCNGSDSDPDSHQWLRYLIHLRFASSKSGKIYLHTDIRMLIFRKSDADAAALHNTDTPYELRSFTSGPRNPKFSPRK